MDASIGIYKIVCTENNKIYIGQSKNIQKRWTQHKNELTNNKHGNHDLQNDFNKFGELAFKFDIVHLGELETLDMLERFYIDKYKDRSYNINNGNRDKDMELELTTEEFILLKKFKEEKDINLDEVRNYMLLIQDINFKYNLVNIKSKLDQVSCFISNDTMFTELETYIYNSDIKDMEHAQALLNAKLYTVVVLLSAIVTQNIRLKLGKYKDVISIIVLYRKSNFYEGRLILECTIHKTKEKFKKTMYF
jgi:group I intron endonuclease